MVSCSVFSFLLVNQNIYFVLLFLKIIACVLLNRFFALTIKGFFFQAKISVCNLLRFIILENNLGIM